MSPDLRLRWAPAPRAGGRAQRRAVAWMLLRELAGGDIGIDNPCPRCGGPHGPVRLSGTTLHGAVAYAGDVALAAVMPVPFAIDAEPETDDVRDTAGLRGVLGAGTAVAVRDWVRVEAALKADGRGLRVDPAQVSVVGLAGSGWRATVPGADEPIEGWDAAGPPGMLLSVALSPAPRSAAAAAAEPGPATA